MKKVAMRKLFYLTVTAVFAIGTPRLHGQDEAAIQKALTSRFALTKTTADGMDVVKPGSILVLQKNGLQMFSVPTKIPPTIPYGDGKLSFRFGDKFATCFALSHAQPPLNCDSVPQRMFVAGEKFWITAFLVKDKQVVLLVYSDPYQNVRYFGQLKFPYNKKSIPSADDLLKTIAEVVIVEPLESSSSGVEQPQSSAQDTSALAPITPPPTTTGDPSVAMAEPAEISSGGSGQSQPSAQGSPALASITPPPPPTATTAVATKTIALGQTKDQVVASFGQPQKIDSSDHKEIYCYPDMKVTFVNGRVTDVQ
jgi:hypothetical protein